MKMNKDCKNTKKRGRKILTVFVIIFSAVILINLISFFINQLFFSHEIDNILPYGKLVDVNGESMHVYSIGKGEEIIVLLPGFTLPLPSAEFGPLMRELSKKYTVVCVEYFGVGFSSQSKIPRTNENYTEEIRSALYSAGFSPPYILMPHSGSGIYSEYYASKYPDEISSIIMLDTTSSAQTSTNVPKFVYSLGKVQQAIGLSRFINPILVSSVLKINEDNGYTIKEIKDYTKFINHCYNDTIVDQLFLFNKNIEELMNMDFPNKIPVLKLVASETAKRKHTGEKYQNAHISRLGDNAQWTIIDGNHLIYHEHIEEIYHLTNDFLNNK